MVTLTPQIGELSEYLSYQYESNLIHFSSSGQTDINNLGAFEGRSTITVKLIDVQGNEFSYNMDLILDTSCLNIKLDLIEPKVFTDRNYFLHDSELRYSWNEDSLVKKSTETNCGGKLIVNFSMVDGTEIVRDIF